MWTCEHIREVILLILTGTSIAIGIYQTIIRGNISLNAKKKYYNVILAVRLSEIDPSKLSQKTL